MSRASDHFLKPGLFARTINKIVGLLVRVGIGPSYMRLLRVRGRRTGRILSTPVNLLEFRGCHYLVGGRGHTGWSKNADAAGAVELVRGRRAAIYRLRPVTGDLKLEILKAYLDRYSSTVQKFFAVPAGSPFEAFRETSERHPVFELLPNGAGKP